MKRIGEIMTPEFMARLAAGDKTLLPPAKCGECEGTGWDRDQWRNCRLCGGTGEALEAEQQAKREKRT